MVVGGVAIHEDRIEEISQTIANIKDEIGMLSAFRWSDYRAGRKKKAYFKLVQYFFELIENGHMHFHLLICPFSEFNHKLGGTGNQESSVNRMYFQLYLHRFCKFYGTKCYLYGFPDRGNDSSQVVGFREVLCAKAYNKFATLPNCIPAIHPQKSKDHGAIQMVDVVIGSVAAKRERRVLNANKSELADFIVNGAGAPSISSLFPLARY
jgi:hypothetical protein